MKKILGFPLTKYVLILLGAIILGILLLTLCWLIPQSAVKSNIKKSDEILLEEGNYPEVITGYKGSRLDNFTDAVMMIETLGPGESTSAFDRALRNYSVVYEDEGLPAERLRMYLAGETEDRTVTSYARYWCGYLVILRPLFALFNITQIRMLNTALQLLVMVMLFGLMAKLSLGRFIPAYLLAWLVLVPGATASGLQFSAVFYISVISSIVMLLCMKRRSGPKWVPGVIIFISGICTSYFDFLTYPLVTLGFPLCMYFICSRQSLNAAGWIKDGTRLTVTWGCGYLGFWAGKWAAASLLTWENFFADAFDSVSLRMSDAAGTETISAAQVIAKNLSYIPGNTGAIVFAIAIAVFCIAEILKHKGRITINLWLICAMLVIAAIPFIWYAIIKNHSYVHCWFTYRNLSISVLSIALAVISFSESRSVKRTK